MKNAHLILGSVAAMVITGMGFSVSSWAGDTVSAPIQATKAGTLVSGHATFTETDQGLRIEVEISGAPPGKHGFHIHEKGDCADEGKAAGGHFNPDNRPHGDLEKDGMTHAHAGDLGNIVIDSNGTGRLEKIISGLTLHEGKYLSLIHI